MGTRTTRNGASLERTSAPGSGVGPDVSGVFLRMLAKSVQEAEQRTSEVSPFSPGQFFPTDTSILTRITPKQMGPPVEEHTPEDPEPLDEALVEIPDAEPVVLISDQLVAYEALLELARIHNFAQMTVATITAAINDAGVDSSSRALHNLKRMELCLEGDAPPDEPPQLVVVFRPYRRGANGMVVIPEECEPEEPELVEEDEPEPEPLEDTAGDVIQLASKRPDEGSSFPSAASQEEEEDEDEDEGDEDSFEIAEGMLEELLQFAKQAAQERLGSGIQDLDLRRALANLPSDDALIRAIQQGDLPEAKRLVLERRLAAEGVARCAEEYIERHAAAPRRSDMHPTDGVIHQLKIAIDRTLTASAQRLPNELHASNIEAGAQCRIHTEAADAFEEARGQLLPLVRQITAAVADLGMAYEHREELSGHMRTLEGLFRQADTHHGELLGAHAKCQEAEERLREIMDESHIQRMEAKRLVDSLRQLTGSARLLGATVPATIEAQVHKTTSAIELLLSQGQNSLLELVTPDWDAKIEQALGQIKRDRARATHMINPIRPSVFQRRMDRVEELRRLVLIAAHILTYGKTYKKKRGEAAGRPHKGYGKNTLLGEVLVLSNLIDASEVEQCENLLLRLNRHGNVEKELRARLKAEGHTRIKKTVIEAAMDAECGPELMHKERMGTGWVFRPNDEGHRQAQAWLGECVDSERVRSRFENALRTYHKRKYSARAAAAAKKS